MSSFVQWRESIAPLEWPRTANVPEFVNKWLRQAYEAGQKNGREQTLDALADLADEWQSQYQNGEANSSLMREVELRDRLNQLRTE